MRYQADTVYDERFNSIIDNQKYFFKSTLINPDGDILTLTKSSILELNLFDNIFEPFIKGHVIIDNTEDAIERFTTSPEETEFVETKEIKGYTVRGDGRDILKIEIIPLDSTADDSSTFDDSYNKAFALKYLFVLEDENSLDLNGVEAKKYSIIDYDLEILKERKAFFSTTNLVEAPNKSQLSNKDREVATGICLKTILREALNDSSAVKGTIDQNTGKESTPFFEDGISKIFYSSPAQFNAYQDLMYILKKHVSDSTENDFSFLKKENYTGEYTLQSASNIFKAAYNTTTGLTGPTYLENFTITGSSRESGSVIEKTQKKPKNAIEYGEKGEILEFNFFNTSSKLRRDRIKSSIVHSYDFNKKEFNLDVSDSNIENVRNSFESNYVKFLKGNNNKPSPSLIINGLQKKNLSYSNIFSEYGDNFELRKSYGINKLLKDSLITNMGVEITVKGQLQRKSGRFFSLDRAGDYIDNRFDNKLLGFYFILDIQHLFANETDYINKIIAIKTYHFDNPNIKEDKL